jgi:hypothetical protein
VLSILKELEKPAIYNPVLKEKPTNFLLDLYLNHKKDSPKSFIDWNQQRSVQFAISNIKNIVPKYDITQTTRLLTTLTNLKIQDEELWDILCKHLTRKLHKDIDSDNIKDIVFSFYRNQKGTDKLWNTIESVLLTRIFPKHDLKPEAIVTILYAYIKIEKGSEQLLLALEQQIIRVSVLLNGPDIAKILSAFGKLKMGSDILYEELRKQAILIAYQMDQQTLTTVLKSYLIKRKTTQDLLEALEDKISSKLNTFHLANIVQIAALYFELLPAFMQVRNPHYEFAKDILLYAAREVDLVLMNSKDNYTALKQLKALVENLNLTKDLADRQYKKLLEIVSKSKPIQDSKTTLDNF